MTAFTITLEVYRDCAQLTVTGELDLASAHQLAEHGINQLLEPAVTILVLDLGQVSFIDASGIGMLVRLGNVARHVCKRLVLSGVPPCVQRLLDLTGLDIHFEQQSAAPTTASTSFLSPGRRNVQAA